MAASVGFEQMLWAVAHTLCNNMDAAEYNYDVLAQVFLKYIFEAKQAEL